MARVSPVRTIDRKLWLTVASACSRNRSTEAEFVKPVGNDKDNLVQRYVAALLIMKKPCPQTGSRTTARSAHPARCAPSPRGRAPPGSHAPGRTVPPPGTAWAVHPGGFSSREPPICRTYWKQAPALNAPAGSGTVRR